MREYANYQGDIEAFKVSKAMHPSVYYRIGHQQRSLRGKERYRKFQSAWVKFWKRDQHPSLKYKHYKPTYSDEEAELWNSLNGAAEW